LTSPLFLSWKQLVHGRLRLLVATTAVAFAVVLMLLQLGFRDALFGSSVRTHKRLRADIVLISPQSSYLALMKSFPRRRLYQALSVPGVASVASVYTGVPDWKNPLTGNARAIFLIGFDPKEAAVDLPEVAANLDRITLPDRVLFDADSRPEFGPIARDFAEGKEAAAEVGGRRLIVVGVYRIGTSFGIDGSLITSDLNFLRIFGRRDPGSIDIGLIRLKPGADPEATRDAIARVLPNDVEVLTKSGFIDREIDYWARLTPIGYVFTLGTMLGFVIGGIIVYQILFTDVSHHLPDYATLKAIGYSGAYLSAVVVGEAVLLALIGYLPGLAISLEIYSVTAKATLLPMHLGSGIALQVLALTVAMCCLAGLLAMRKVRSADPADVF
jgi:putative ABC transport system permease protein